MNDTRVAAAHAVSRLTQILGACLHEPDAIARRLALGALANAERWRRETLRCVARLERGRGHGIVPSCAEAHRLGAFALYMAEESGPKVLVGCHIGSFVIDLLKMLDAVAPGTRVVAPIPVRSAAALKPLVAYAAAQRKELRLVPIQSVSVLGVRRMRETHDAVVLLADLGAAYGRVADVMFFDMAARLVSGPYQIARLLRAPLVFFTDDAGLGVAFDQPDDALQAADGAASADAAARRYARRIQRAILTDPTRWGRWAQLRELLTDADAHADQHVAASCGRR